MDWIKEIFEAHNQRIKSPIVGSVILAFIAWNWQPIFYMLFSSDAVSERFEFWDANVLFWQDYSIPVFVGITFALLIPMITLIGAYASSWPTNKLRHLTNKQAHSVELEKKKGEQILALTEIGYQQDLVMRKEELEEQRERLIASKLRQQESLSKIEDEEEREKISAEANEGTEGTTIESTLVDMKNDDINFLVHDIDLRFGRSDPKAIKNRWVHESIGYLAVRNPLGSSEFYRIIPQFVKKNLPDSSLPINANLLLVSNEIENFLLEMKKATENRQKTYASRLEAALGQKAAILQKFYLGLDISEFKVDKPSGT